jgi:aurora kinase
VPQGDLFDEMKRTLGRMPEAQLVTSVLLPMMSALLAMHSLGFIHRDIKPENTLFAAGRVLKLAGGRCSCTVLLVMYVMCVPGLHS